MTLRGLTTPALSAKNYRRRVMIYGTPGVGKTTLAASATKPLLLNVDPDGSDSLLQTKFRAIPMIQVQNEKQFKDAVADITSPQEVANDKFQTIILDTVSLLQKFVLTDERAKLGRQVSMNEFNLGNIYMIDPIIQLLRHSKKHVIIICHESEIRAENGSIISYKPDIQPGTLKALRQLLSGVFFYRDRSTATQPIRELCVGSQISIGETKRRIPMPDKFTNPVWTDIEAAFDKFYDPFLDKEDVPDNE